MSWVDFKARFETITWGRATFTILPLPENAVAALGPTRRVEGEIDEHTVNLAITRAPPVEGAFLWAGQGLLDRLGVVPGQAVAVRLRPAPGDAVDVAPDVADALLAGGVTAAWAALTPGKQRGLLYQIDTAKTAPTRQKRLAARVARMLAGD